MSVPADPAEEARTWFTQASEDLSAARHLASNADMPPRLAAFLAHLAAEKALKATLIARGVAIRKIHDLVALQAYLPAEDAVSLSSDDIDVLVPWNIAGRYPADLDDVDQETATSAVNAAERIVTALTQRIINS
jgi:HEPN domain-containing protein